MHPSAQVALKTLLGLENCRICYKMSPTLQSCAFLYGFK